jgi:hypothetical protein
VVIQESVTSQILELPGATSVQVARHRLPQTEKQIMNLRLIVQFKYMCSVFAAI